MHLVGTLYVFRFEHHLQLELLINREPPALETLGALHGQRVEIDLALGPELDTQPHAGMPTRQAWEGEHLT